MRQPRLCCCAFSTLCKDCSPVLYAVLVVSDICKITGEVAAPIAIHLASSTEPFQRACVE